MIQNDLIQKVIKDKSNNNLIRLLEYDAENKEYVGINLSTTKMMDLIRIPSFNEFIDFDNEFENFVPVSEPFVFDNNIKGKLTQQSYEKGIEQKTAINLFLNQYSDKVLNEMPERVYGEIAKKMGLNWSGRKLKRLTDRYLKSGKDEKSLYPGHYRAGNKHGNKSMRPGPRGKETGQKGKSYYTAVFEEYYQVLISRKGLRQNQLNGRTITQVYDQMIKEKFTKNGMLDREHPSKRMFYDFVREKPWNEKYIAKKGIRDFDLNQALLMGDERHELQGFMELVQVDSTELDLHLVDRYEPRKPVGRAYLTIAIDVLTKLIVAFYVTLKAPSYDTGSEMLINLIENTEVTYQEYGLDLDPAGNTFGVLPQTILADNAEFETFNSNKLVEKLGVNIQNARTYTPTDKGTVERIFGEINGYIKQNNIKGAVYKDYSTRGDVDPKDEAVMTLDGIRRLVAAIIERHNRKEIQEFKLKRKEMVNNIHPIPSELKDFYVQEGLDFSRRIEDIKDEQNKKLTEEDIKKLLLPSEKRTVQREGIQFKHLIYNSEDEETRIWLTRNRRNRFDMFYDPRDLSHIFLDDGNELITLDLSGSSKTYQKISLAELCLLEKQFKQQDEKREESRMKLEEIEDFLDEEVARINAIRPLKKENKDKRGIRENRRQANEDEDSLSYEIIQKALEDKDSDKQDYNLPDSILRIGAA